MMVATLGGARPMTHIGKSCYRLALGGLLSLILVFGATQRPAAQSPAEAPPAPTVAPKTPSATLLQKPPLPATEYFLKYLGPNATLETYLKLLRREFRAADADGNDEISEADAVLRGQMSAAAFRAIFIASLLRADLNNDAAVTEDELRTTLRYERRLIGAMVPPGSSEDAQLDARIRLIMAADADHDGKITIGEARNFVASRPENASLAALAGSVPQLLALRPEDKAVLTRPDFEAAAAKLFREIDTNGDGTVSAEELAAFRAQHGKEGAATSGAPPENQGVLDALRLQEAARQRRQEAMKQRMAAQRGVAEEQAKKLAELQAMCAMPKASDDAKLVIIGSYGPEALSSVTIGSQDVAVRTGTITVEPGKQPIYLVMLSFDASIWRLRGAVGRIERLVLTAGRPERVGELPQDKPIVGATNIAADRITFLPPGRCLAHFIEAPSEESATAAAKIIREVGKGAATIAGRYSFSDVAVPSGRIRSLRGANEGKTLIIQQGAGALRVIGGSKNIVVQAGAIGPKTNLHRFSPGGVVTIDPKTVVALLPVEKYQVLPQEAGLIQLVKEGKIAQNRSGEFLIKKKIRFPASLVGAHLVKFLLLRGVPAPDGDPGHSTVISEETGDRLKFGAATR